MVEPTLGTEHRTFRDPAGYLTDDGQSIIRRVYAAAVPDLLGFLATSTAARFLQQGSLIATEILDSPPPTDSPPGDVTLTHPRVAFPSYPFEWSPMMLAAAAGLTLALTEATLAEGFGLKDATPYNVLFNGPRPVFVDILSFERRAPNDPTWLAYSQFVATFLLPLLANRHFKLALEPLLLSRRDGLTPDDIYPLCRPWQRFQAPFLSLVSLPVWLSGRSERQGEGLYQAKPVGDPAQARFVLQALLRHLRRLLDRSTPRRPAGSAWSTYTGERGHYTDDALADKRAFVAAGLSESRARRVLDVGANTGEFSVAAARLGAAVVAIDIDPAVVDRIWQTADAESLDILPLVINLCRPTPATGWRNQETLAFSERARGRFDAVLMLAVIHHMMVTEGIPLPAILQLAAEMTTDLAIIEFVAPDDPMFRRLARGRDHLYAHLTPETFEQACQPHFKVIRQLHLAPARRWLYWLQKLP